MRASVAISGTPLPLPPPPPPSLLLPPLLSDIYVFFGGDYHIKFSKFLGLFLSEALDRADGWRGLLDKVLGLLEEGWRQNNYNLSNLLIPPHTHSPQKVVTVHPPWQAKHRSLVNLSPSSRILWGPVVRFLCKAVDLHWL